MKNHWNLRTSLNGSGTRDFLASSRWDCPYIIRLGFNGACHVYDTRQYSKMATIDYNYFGYSVVSSHKTQDAAKRKIAKLMKQSESGNRD